MCTPSIKRRFLSFRFSDVGSNNENGLQIRHKELCEVFLLMSGCLPLSVADSLILFGFAEFGQDAELFANVKYELRSTINSEVSVMVRKAVKAKVVADRRQEKKAAK